MKKLKYVTLFTDGTWGVMYMYYAEKYESMKEHSKVSRSNNSTKAIKSKISMFLLGNENSFQSDWIKGTDWTRERLADCLENPSKYKRKGMKKGFY